MLVTAHGIEVSVCAGRHLIGKIAYHSQETLCQTLSIHFNIPVSQRFQDWRIVASNYIYPSMWDSGGYQERYRRSLTMQRQLTKSRLQFSLSFWQTPAGWWFTSGLIPQMILELLNIKVKTWRPGSPLTLDISPLNIFREAYLLMSFRGSSQIPSLHSLTSSEPERSR